MKPNYKKYCVKKGGDIRAVNMLSPVALREMMEFVATTESDTMGALIQY